MWTSLVSTVSGLFGTSAGKWIGTGIAGLAVVTIIVWLGWTRAEFRADYEAERSTRLLTEVAYQSSKAALDALKRASTAKDAALVQRDEQIKTINADREALRRRWQEAIQHDETVRNWADAPLPDAVRSLLR